MLRWVAFTMSSVQMYKRARSCKPPAVLSWQVCKLVVGGSLHKGLYFPIYSFIFEKIFWVWLKRNLSKGMWDGLQERVR